MLYRSILPHSLATLARSRKKLSLQPLALPSLVCPPLGRAFPQQFQWMVAPSCVLYQSARVLLYCLLSLCSKTKVRSLFDLPSAALWAVKSDSATRPGGNPARGTSPPALSVPSSRPAFDFRIDATAILIFLSPLDAFARKKWLPDPSHLTGK